MAPSDDRPFPGEGEPSPDDESGDRIAGLRESIAKRLEEVVHALGEELRSETKERLSQHASTLDSASKAQAQALVDRVSEQLRIGYETVANETATRTNELESSLTEKTAALESQVTAKVASWSRARTRLAQIDRASRQGRRDRIALTVRDAELERPRPSREIEAKLRTRSQPR